MLSLYSNTILFLSIWIIIQFGGLLLKPTCVQSYIDSKLVEPVAICISVLCSILFYSLNRRLKVPISYSFRLLGSICCIAVIAMGASIAFAKSVDKYNWSRSLCLAQTEVFKAPYFFFPPQEIPEPTPENSDVSQKYVESAFHLTVLYFSRSVLNAFPLFFVLLLVLRLSCSSVIRPKGLSGA